jgi:protein SCO1/2
MRVLLFCLALLLGACSPPAKFNGSDLKNVDWGRELALTGHDGKPYGLGSFKGRAVVLFFGYTQCPDVCPITMGGMRELMATLGADAQRVQVLFVTVDPERDTPQLLAQYVPSFHPSFLGLYGDSAMTAKVAAEFKIFYPQAARQQAPRHIPSITRLEAMSSIPPDACDCIFATEKPRSAWPRI